MGRLGFASNMEYCGWAAASFSAGVSDVEPLMRMASLDRPAEHDHASECLKHGVGLRKVFTDVPDMIFEDVFGRVEVALDEYGFQCQFVFGMLLQLLFHHVAGEIVLRGGEQFQQQGCGDDDQQLRPAFERLYEFVKHLHNICNERSVVENSYKDNAKILIK